jgi:hypothetical protein
MPRRTPKDAELAGRVRGMPAHLKWAGVDAARSVEASPLGSMYLPYGIVFGLVPASLGPVAEVGVSSESAWYRGQGPFAVREFCSRIQRLVGWRATTSPTFIFWEHGSDRGGFWGWGGLLGSGGSSDGGGGGGGGDSW